MIDQSKLALLSIEALTSLREAVNHAFLSRQRQELRVGRQVTFKAKTGADVRMMITGFGPKNVMGYEIDAQGNHLHWRKWRVNPTFCNMVPDVPKVVAKPLGFGGDRPASPGGIF